MFQARRRGLKVIKSVQENLSCVSDFQRVLLVLFNLLQNALKYTQEGSITVKAKKVAKDSDEFIRISVRDSGVGISKENQQKIMEFGGNLDFSQNLQSKSQGIGLRLFVTKAICIFLGEELALKSEVNRGSKFSFVLKSFISMLPKQIA